MLATFLVVKRHCNLLFCFIGSDPIKSRLDFDLIPERDGKKGEKVPKPDKESTLSKYTTHILVFYQLYHMLMFGRVLLCYIIFKFKLYLKLEGTTQC